MEKDFANHKNIIAQLEINLYYAKPYHNWQRRANENLNGLIRKYFTKKCDFNIITIEQIKQIQNKLNNRPRMRLSYKNPNEVFAKKLN